MLTGLSQRVAYFYPTGVTLLHTSSPSSFRARFRAVAWTRVCAEITWAKVAGRGLVWHRARLHQQRGRAQLGQEDNPSPEPCLFGRGDPVVAWEGRRTTNNCWLKVFYYSGTHFIGYLPWHLPRSLISFLGWCEVCEHWGHVFRAGCYQLQRRALSVEMDWTWTIQELTGCHFFFFLKK